MKLKISDITGKFKFKYTIKKDLKNLEISKLYITNFFKILWNYPEAVAFILNSVDDSEVSKNLSKFFVHNFFINFLSDNYLQNSLLYIITIMLKKEIDGIKNISEANKFLDNSNASFLLEEMSNFPDIQLYFRKIIFQMLEKLENNFSWKKMEFNMKQISENIKLFIKSEEKKLNKKQKITKDDLCIKYINLNLTEPNIDTNIENEPDEEDNEKNKSKYTLDPNFLENTVNIRKYELDGLIKNTEKSEKKDLNLFYHYLSINLANENCQDLYSNKILEQFTVDKEIDFNYLLYMYQYDFINVITLLDIFLEDLINNSSAIPDSIKYVSKIISFLIKKKFKDIPKHIENAFISKFFVDKLLIPILQSPNYNALINNFIISGYTSDNLSFIIYILKKMFSCHLFQINLCLPNGESEKNYTLFNRYILNNIEKIFFFHEKIINVSLPSLIDKYINNKLPKDYMYNYFSENPGEIYGNISICFTLTNLFNIINTLKKNENEFFSTENNNNNKLKKTYNKLKYDDKMKEIEDLDKTMPKGGNKKLLLDKNKTKNAKNNQEIIENEHFYIINENSIDNNYEDIFKIDNKTNGYHIDIKKLGKEKELEEKEINLIKVKNYLINLLRDYKILNQSSFKSTKDIYNILLQMKNKKNLNKDKVLSNWCISSILALIQNIPEEYKKNDYKKCFEELTEELKKSLKQYNLEKLFFFKKSVETIKEVEEEYIKYIDLIENINKNIKIKKFAEEYFLPIEFIFNYEDEERIFKIRKINIRKKSLNDKDIIENKNKKFIIRNISSFAKCFPDLNKYQELMGENPFQIITELLINKKLFDYFDIIKNEFIHEYNITEKEYDEIYDSKMKNYIMNKIFKKVYPKEFENEDCKFLEKTMHLSWVEPNMIIKGNVSHEILDNLLPDIISEFKKLNKSYSPFEKFLCIKKIFDLLIVIIKFNDGIEGDEKNIGADDITPYLNFILIRVCPVNILSDIKFIRLFMKNEGEIAYFLSNIEMMCKSILESTYKDYNISESEFIKKCNEIVSNKENNEKRFDEIITRFQKLDNNK